jgi:hypothetical protein
LALLIPLGLWLSRALAPRPHLQWAITHNVPAPNDEELWNSGRFLDGGQIFLSNEGGAPTGEVRVRFDLVPEHIDAYSFGTNQDLSPAEDTDELALGSLEPEHEVRIDIFGYPPYGGVTVLEDGEPVRGLFFDPSEFDDPEAWFPDWAIHAGALLIAGLALEVLSLRGQRRSAWRKGAFGPVQRT